SSATPAMEALNSFNASISWTPVVAVKDITVDDDHAFEILHIAKKVHNGSPHVLIYGQTPSNPPLSWVLPQVLNDAGLHLSRQFDANVSWIEVNDRDYRIRTFERGVDAETCACGSACAAFALAFCKPDEWI